MPVDNTTNLNINNSSDILGNRDIDKASATTKPVELHPVTNNKGITDVSSNTENDFITTFSGTPKTSLRQPDVSLGQLAEQTLTLAPEAAKMLNLSTQPILGEFITSCVGKLTGDIGKTALDAATLKAGDTLGKFDSEMLDCLILLLTMDSKSNLIQTLKDTLQAKINDRTANNQKQIDKNVEVAEKNAEAIKKQEEAEARRKAWGILGAALSIVAAIVACAFTVATCGVGSSLAIAMTTLAISGCAATCVGSGLTIAGLAAGNEALQKAGMWCGVAGGVLSLASGIGSIWAAANHVNNLLRIMATISGAVSGVTSSSGQIVDGINQMDLAKTEKELANLKIDLKKLDKEIEVLSDMIDKVANAIQNFMKDLFQDEEEVARMVQQMMKTSLDIGSNVKC